MEFERRKRRHTHIDMAPLVDVVFNLLLFFVITYNVTVDSGIRIRLPESQTAESQAVSPLVISLSPEGNVYVGDDQIEVEALPDIVRERLAAENETSIRIKADQQAHVEMLIKVVDGVKLGGCTAFSIITEKKGEEAPVDH
ncbi:MAG: biopolymer transporter ExbD [Syntrophobacteraceae bacterium]|jgi:biopolymer transport protein ExbD|nr:biopolymer transporter ExbD [Syntrophobacteraceae bacterium]